MLLHTVTRISKLVRLLYKVYTLVKFSSVSNNILYKYDLSQVADKFTNLESKLIVTVVIISWFVIMS